MNPFFYKNPQVSYSTILIHCEQDHIKTIREGCYADVYHIRAEQH